MRRKIVSAWMVLVASLLVGCSDDAGPNGGTDAGLDGVATDAGSDAKNDSDAAVGCFLQNDDTCSEGCREIQGYPWDEENQCWHEPVRFHCHPKDSGGHTTVTCYVNKETGQIYRTPMGYGQADDSPFRECNEEKEVGLLNEPACD